MFPDTREQRCWFHVSSNVLAALPKSAHPSAKAALAEIYNAEDKAHALKAVKAFEADYGAKWPKTVAKITEHVDVPLAGNAVSELLRLTNPDIRVPQYRVQQLACPAASLSSHATSWGSMKIFFTAIKNQTARLPKNPSTRTRWLTVVVPFLKVVSWALAALLLAGVTRVTTQNVNKVSPQRLLVTTRQRRRPSVPAHRRTTGPGCPGKRDGGF